MVPMQGTEEVKRVQQEEKESGFKREITLFDAIMIVTGGMIGSGIFIVTADISRAVVSPGNMLLVWVLGGALELTDGGTVHTLGAGDCLRFRLWAATRFRNPGRVPVRYAIVQVLP